VTREPWFSTPDETEEAWRDAFERAFRHVPLSLYDEDQKPAERVFGEMLSTLREAANSHSEPSA
jgi:hypothetical protein